MTKKWIMAALLASLPAPALATGGFDCEATDGSGLAIGGTVGRTVGSPLIHARLRIGERVLTTYEDDASIAIARAWLDEHEMKVDLVDSNAERFEAQLRARPTGEGEATGTLTRDGVSHPVRCDLE